jgi:hypothetical protein
MAGMRSKAWFPVLSVLLTAAFVSAQAAGCCKLSVLFHSAPVASALPDAGEEAPVSPENAPADPSMGDHACCHKQADQAEPAQSAARMNEAEPAPVEPAKTDPCHGAGSPGAASTGCCLQGAGLDVADMASVPSLTGPDLIPAPTAMAVEFLPLPRPAYVTVSALDSGPPESRSNLPLLI